MRLDSADLLVRRATRTVDRARATIVMDTGESPGPWAQPATASSSPSPSTPYPPANAREDTPSDTATRRSSPSSTPQPLAPTARTRMVLGRRAVNGRSGEDSTSVRAPRLTIRYSSSARMESLTESSRSSVPASWRSRTDWAAENARWRDATSSSDRSAPASPFLRAAHCGPDMIEINDR